MGPVYNRLCMSETPEFSGMQYSQWRTGGWFFKSGTGVLWEIVLIRNEKELESFKKE